MEQEIRWLLEEKYAGRRTRAFLADLKRLEKGEHVDYIIGWKPFLGCKIDLRYKPLIPRTETEYWVEQAIREVRPRPSANDVEVGPRPKCLDIFAGSGCIGVAVLKHVPGAKVDFTEKEKKFCKQIVLNAKLNNITKSRYRVIRSDIFSKVKGKYDYIFANPPYLAESRRGKIQKSVLAQEPHSALFAGKDGLKYIRLFLSRTKDFLKKDGVIYLEFDSWQKPKIAEIVRSFNFRDIEFFKDQYNKWRFVRIEV